MKNPFLIFGIVLFFAFNVLNATEAVNKKLTEDFYYCLVTHYTYMDGVLVDSATFKMSDGHPDCGGVVMHWLTSNQK